MSKQKHRVYYVMLTIMYENIAESVSYIFKIRKLLQARCVMSFPAEHFYLAHVFR